MFSDLPTDKDEQDVTQAPPPAWFRPSGLMFPTGFPFGLGGYGDRESEVEVNPIEFLQNLKFKQEMPKSIPAVASRYTNIDPLSPLFRSNHAKYGFGEIATPKSMISIVVAIGIIWLLFFKG